MYASLWCILVLYSYLPFKCSYQICIRVSRIEPDILHSHSVILIAVLYTIRLHIFLTFKNYYSIFTICIWNGGHWMWIVCGRCCYLYRLSCTQNITSTICQSKLMNERMMLAQRNMWDFDIRKTSLLVSFVNCSVCLPLKWRNTNWQPN